MGVRVIRTLEYHYIDLSVYEEDRTRWTETFSPMRTNGRSAMRTIGVQVSVDDGPWFDYDAAEQAIRQELDLRTEVERQQKIKDQLEELGLSEKDLPR